QDGEDELLLAHVRDALDVELIRDRGELADLLLLEDLEVQPRVADLHFLGGEIGLRRQRLDFLRSRARRAFVSVPLDQRTRRALATFAPHVGYRMLFSHLASSLGCYRDGANTPSGEA